MAFRQKSDTETYSNRRVAPSQSSWGVVYEVDTITSLSQLGKQKAAALIYEKFDFGDPKTTLNAISATATSIAMGNTRKVLGSLANTLPYTAPTSSGKAGKLVSGANQSGLRKIAPESISSSRGVVTAPPKTTTTDTASHKSIQSKLQYESTSETDYATELLLLEAAGVSTDATPQEETEKRKRESPVAFQSSSTCLQSVHLPECSDGPKHNQFKDRESAISSAKRVNFASVETLNGYVEVSPVGASRSTVEFRESLRQIGINRKAAVALKVRKLNRDAVNHIKIEYITLQSLTRGNFPIYSILNRHSKSTKAI